MGGIHGYLRWPGAAVCTARQEFADIRGNEKRAWIPGEITSRSLRCPPLCKDTVAGGKLRDNWVRKHGWPVVVKKSEAVMTTIKTRICVAVDGTLTGRASGLPPGEHEAEIALVDTGKSAPRPDAATLLTRVRAIQAEMARLPALDGRSPDEIIGYNERGHFD